MEEITSKRKRRNGSCQVFKRKTRRLKAVLPEINSGNICSCKSDVVSAASSCSCRSSSSSSSEYRSSNEEEAEGRRAKFVDLDKKLLEDENVNSFVTSAPSDDSLDCIDSSETTPLSEEDKVDQLETTAPRQRVSNSQRRSSMAKKVPSEAEIEEFFAAAEKNIQKQFVDKYNYDIVKDEPLEGRYDYYYDYDYEWVRIEEKP